MALFVDSRFPLSFYYRIADKIIEEAGVYREEGDSEGLCHALNRYSRMISEIIPHHPSYSVHSNEMLQHKKILQQVAKELQNLNSQIAGENVRISRCSTGCYRQSESDSHNSHNGHKMDLQNTAFTVQLGRGANIRLANAVITTDNEGATIQFGSIDFLSFVTQTTSAPASTALARGQAG